MAAGQGLINDPVAYLVPSSVVMTWKPSDWTLNVAV